MNADMLQVVARAVAEERSVAAVLQTIVRGLSDQPYVALARIWLIDSGDICASCPMRRECQDLTRCLHLVASAGNPHNPQEDWSRLDGAFRRFPLQVRKIGRVGATGEAIMISDMATTSHWIAHPDWTVREQIKAFACQPLIFRGETFGVLAVFRRVPCSEEDFRWLRAFADQAAIAIANARAFEEITRLKERLQMENEYLREEVTENFAGAIIGQSQALKSVLLQVQMVAPTDANVLIQGESGTGKEVIARAIHERSQRRHRPLIKVNCASVARELFESEFFGHVKGAFTGAVRDRLGRFQLADGGTIFLDEIGEIPLELQSKLLRVLQEGEFERVGEERTRKIDVRVIAATNRDLKSESDAGTFRLDLYYRLCVFPIHIAPLRERQEDIAPLANHFLQAICRKLNRPNLRLTEQHLELLKQGDWVGNARELQHVIERAAILSQGATLQFDFLLGDLPAKNQLQPLRLENSFSDKALVTENEIRQRARDNIINALAKANGKIYGAGGAAQLLNLKPTTLASRMKVMGIKKRND